MFLTRMAIEEVAKETEALTFRKELKMKDYEIRTLLIVVAILILPAAPVFGQGEPVQWALSAGGNGHYYEVVEVEDTLNWNEAKAEAELRIHNGVNGHLATITSAEEQAFIQNNVLPWDSTVQGPWIGGYQHKIAPDYSEPAGGWRWITGEPWVYTNWSGGGPNNGGINGEEALHIYSNIEPSDRGKWNDASATGNYWIWYMVEYEAAPGIPMFNSIIDWSGVQGQNNVTYMYHDYPLSETEPLPMNSYVAAEEMWKNTWDDYPWIQRNGWGSPGTRGHIGSPAIVIRWEVEQTGNYLLRMTIQRHTFCNHPDHPWSDGLEASILDDSITPLVIDTDYCLNELKTLEANIFAKQGEFVYYRISSRESNSSDHFHDTFFYAYLIEPEEIPYQLKVSGEKILLSNSQGVEGGSFGLAYDPSVIAITNVTSSGIMEILPNGEPEYLQVVLNPILEECPEEIQAGVSVAWANSLSTGDVVIPAGENQEIFTIQWEPVERPADVVSPVNFVNCLKAREDAPPVEIVVTVAGESIIPGSEDGEIFIGGFFRRGDANEDGKVDIADAIRILSCLFIPGKVCPRCQDAMDNNDDGVVDIADAIYLLFWLFSPKPSPAPPSPGPYQCGPDPTLDQLLCEVSQPGCEGEPPFLPDQWDWVSYRGHQYALTLDYGSWEQAEAEAVLAGGHLVTINDEDENNWVISTFSEALAANLWIGLYQDHDDPSYSEPDGGWKWISGEPVTYLGWYGLEPNNQNGEDYGVIFQSPHLFWNDWGPTSIDYYPTRGIIEVIPE